MKKTKDRNSKLRQIFQSLIWITVLALSSLVIMVWISGDTKALPVFLIGFFGMEVIVILLALYINYVVSVYKQIKGKL